MLGFSGGATGAHLRKSGYLITIFMVRFGVRRM